MHTLGVAAVLAVGAVLAGLIGLAALAAGIAPPPGSPPSVVGGVVAEIPSGLEAVYRDAALTYCDGLPWEVLAGIGSVESGHARGNADPATGEVHPRIIGPAIDGRPGFAAIPDPTSADGWAHAEGPMQFLPSTWRRWATLAPGRPPGAVPSPHNAWDAIHSAARMLCGGRPVLDDLRRAVFGYNRSWDYVDKVFERADRYRELAATASSTTTVPLDAR